MADPEIAFECQQPETPEAFALLWRHIERKFGVVSPTRFAQITIEVAAAATRLALASEGSEPSPNVVPIATKRQKR